MVSIAIVFLVLPILPLGEAAQQKPPSTQINLGSTISLKSAHRPTTSWSSPSGQFQFGFYEQDDGFAVGICLVGNDQKTVVWTANRDDPPIMASSNATLSLDENGKLLLRTEDDGKEKLIANTTQTAVSASMLDSGNFVLYNKQSHIIWESFQHPTDTILGGQYLLSGSQLFSSVSETDRKTGRFHLKMQVDGNLVLYPINNEDTTTDAYWSSNTATANYTAGVKYDLYLNDSGFLAIVNRSISKIVVTFNYYNRQSGNLIYRATLDANGIFRLYSHAYDDKKKNTKVKEAVLVWSALENACQVKGFCGLNSFCTFFDDQPNCLCLPGSDFADLNKKTLGCFRNYSDGGCRDGKENGTLYGMVEMENILWPETYYAALIMSKAECNIFCLEDCNCGAALFKKMANNSDACFKHKLPLRYVKRNHDEGEPTTAFFKVGKSTTKTRNHSIDETKKQEPRTQVTSKDYSVQILALALGLVIFSCVCIAVTFLYVSKIRVLRYKRLRDIKGQFGLIDEEVTLCVFSYNELKRATNGFKEELGRGSFGAVYKGALNKGRKLVAVKRLEKLIEDGEREFRTEMRAISRTNHMNLVRLIGYCAEDSKRLLVYEYMSNGSLADLLFKQVNNRPYWEERVRIAVEVAKGIHYLHEECQIPIIHCDVKPQNILMDDLWTAKISDFGLAKLLMPDQTRTFTGIRGTRGYLAPEWQQNTPITVKVDVYSYGIVLLEIICCRRNLEINVPNAEEIVLSNWVYKCFAGRELDKLVVGEDVDKRTLEKMAKVGLWCIQDEAVLRPSMKSVVLMLEGITDIASPPCPTSAAM